MNATERGKTAAQFYRDVRESFGCSKPNVLAAVDALDDYLTTNATAINTAIPQPARGAMTVQQKLVLIAYVALMRAGKLKIEGE